MLNKLKNHTTPSNSRLLVGYSSVLTAAVVAELIHNKLEVDRGKSKPVQYKTHFSIEFRINLMIHISPCNVSDRKQFDGEIQGCVNKIFKGFNQFSPSPNIKTKVTNKRNSHMESMINNLKTEEKLPDSFSIPESLVRSLLDFHRYPSKGQPLDTFHSELIYQYCRKIGIRISRRSIFK